MSPVCKMADNELLTVDQMVKVVLFYAETKSAVATRRRFRAHFCTRWAPCKQTIYRLSLGTIFQPMRINSVPDVKCFCSNKNVLCVQSMVQGFILHYTMTVYTTVFLKMDPRIRNTQKTKNKLLNINLEKVNFVLLYCVTARTCSLPEIVN